MSLFAVHIADGPLSPIWLIGGGITAITLLIYSLWRFDSKYLPRIGCLAAVFFLSSQFHFQIGIASVHLLLNGLVGVMLGRFAVIAILQGLILQYLLFSHGGYLTLGINLTILALPALVVSTIAKRFTITPSRAFWLGICSSGMSVLLNFCVLLLGGIDDWKLLANWVLISHLPIIVLEGVILAVIIPYLQQVKPSLMIHP
ncbi:CbiM family transporter [Tuwongella immobilis]|uniref:Cobalamin biosynthesis protein CbiM n=1 Tax=Tuwongella immobilis TaxID=692036 RepID=A0A6C2YPR7_9BACT|nr:CbiM family transporter [Tuwongella immobilis]VIP03123.1 cobalamin (vitamin b12) biosynthesis protein : Cobalamin (Vitamin B12) biosynthesis CbiM protein OS=Caldithrix abyssi DSM 13497 GN=Calab_3678 PE=4 SV=1: CbiM [Tuwongella immobilis]VTS03457.1 cobalamin (vitamin b12) biosynthesis protein : Cobalamin (Vitamin B12) biosynthesis CbiM protein OS=Caldithrix abyssi DSM 13497 GN=Calab_3678 PE=4 SV=1: CbiM [Tuwongella immobilis]